MSKRHLQFWRLLLITFSLISNKGFTQTITNVAARVEGELVHITYDLLAGDGDETFEVLLFGSANNYIMPLQKLSGDVGKNVQPGLVRKIIWDAGSELLKYRGEIILEIRVNVFVPYVSFQFPAAGTTLKRSSTHMIQWSGGNPSDQLQLELFQEGVKVSTIEQTDNVGKFNWAIPVDIKPGKNYQLKITSVNDQSNSGISPEFSVKRKVPLGLKLLPIAAVAAVIPLVVGGTTTTEPDIPDPANPE